MHRPLALALVLLLALAAAPAAPAALAGPGVAAVEVPRNTAAITIPHGGQAAPYPSTIEAGGLAGGVATSTSPSAASATPTCGTSTSSWSGRAARSPSC